MSAPGTRHFIGPLTPAQRRRRERSRENFRNAAEIADARNLTMREAFYVSSYNRLNRFALGYLSARSA